MVTVADLGILRDVAAEDGRLVVTITPTYSGCPALREIAHDLRRRLTAAGFAEVTVRTALAPAWSSDWITAEGRRKLQAAGIAPPQAVPPRQCHLRQGRPTRARSRSPSPPAASRSLARGADPATQRRPPRSAGPRARRCSAARPAASRSNTSRKSDGLPPAGRAEFHPLTVARVDPLTDDSAAVTFDVPPALADRFAFAPGQSVTIRRGDERRSYSICAAAGRARRASACARWRAARCPAGSCTRSGPAT